MKQFKENQEKALKVVGVGFAVSVLLNAVLGLSAIRAGGTGDNYEGDAATEISFYEEQAQQLQTKNDALTAQVDELQHALATADESEDTPDTPEGDSVETATQPTGSTDTRDALRATIRESTLGFLDGLINIHTGNETNEQRRERLDPYTTQTIAARIAPTTDELADMGLVGHADDDGADVQTDDTYIYVQEITGLQLYFDEASLGGSTVHVIAHVDSRMEDNMDAAYTLNERYFIQLTREGGEWIVSDYTIERVN